MSDELRTSRTAAPSGRIVAILGAWLVVAILAGATGRAAALKPPLPQVIILVLAAGTLAALRLVPSLRAWSDGVEARGLVALHLTRFVAGGTFLLYWKQGRLPHDFAVPAGLGDMVVAVLAAFVVFGPPVIDGAARWRCLAWNALGLIDIGFVIATAARLAMAEPDSMRQLVVLPLSLLPTFLVPLVVATHVLIFLRLRRRS